VAARLDRIGFEDELPDQVVERTPGGPDYITHHEAPPRWDPLPFGENVDMTLLDRIKVRWKRVNICLKEHLHFTVQSVHMAFCPIELSPRVNDRTAHGWKRYAANEGGA